MEMGRTSYVDLLMTVRKSSVSIPALLLRMVCVIW